MPKKDVAAKKDREEQKASTSLSLERPHRPLNAYNLFFQEERRRMLDRAQVRGEESRFGFGDMARIVSKRWKSISDTEKAHFQRLAELEKQRYYREMNVWYAAINDDSSDEAEDDPAGGTKKQKQASEKEKKQRAQPPADRGSASTLPISQPSGTASAAMHHNEAASQIGSSRQEPAVPASERSSLIFSSFPDSINQPSDGYLFQFSESASSSWVGGIENPFSAQLFARSLDHSDSKDGAGDQDFIPLSAGGALPLSIHPISNQARIRQEDILKSVEGATGFSRQQQFGGEEMGVQHQQQEPPFNPEAVPQRYYEAQDLLTLSTRRQQYVSASPSSRRSSTEASRMRLLASRLGPEAVDFVVDAFQDGKKPEGKF